MTSHPLRFVAVLGAAISLTAAVGQATKWVARYDGPGHGTDKAWAVALDSSGNTIVTGCSMGLGTGCDYCTIKYDASGNVVWLDRYDGPAHGDDWGEAVVVDGDDNAYVTGFSAGGAGSGRGICTIKYDSLGNRVWLRRYEGLGHGDDSGYAIALDESRNVYVAGNSTGVGTWRDACVLKYDADGNLLWDQHYDGTAHADDSAYSMAIDSAGNVVVTGFTTGVGTAYDLLTIKYDANGNQLWAQVHDGLAHTMDEATRVAADANGNVYVTGEVADVSLSNQDICTIKYDANGNQLWLRTFDGPRHSFDIGQSIAVDSAANVYVAGIISNASGDDFCTLKYDTNGNLLWARPLGVTNWWDNQANAMAIGANGDVFVTGHCTPTGRSADCCTAEYDPNGNQLWMTTYDGAVYNWDECYAIAVDGAGNCVVTGFSDNWLGDADFVTVMYSPLPSTMSGHVDLDSCAGTIGRFGELQYRLPGSTTPLYSVRIDLDANGDFQGAPAPIGTFDIACKCPNWLRKVQRNVSIGASGSSVSFSLRNGDAFADNKVDLLDLSMVLSNDLHFGTPPVAGDLNWDGEIQLVDLSIVLANFGMQGDP